MTTAPSWTPASRSRTSIRSSRTRSRSTGRATWAARLTQAVDTGVSRDQAGRVEREDPGHPEEFNLHPRVAKIYADRAKMAAGELPIDWGFAENLAYATVIADGHDLRLVGQDSGRGTFFHRHAVLHDQNSGRDVYVPLTRVREGATLRSIDSLLSEEAVMAFEYGYSTAEPEHAGDLGSPVRRFRQRRASRDRPVHLFRRSEVGPTVRAWCCCCRTATKARDRNIRRPAWSATCSCARSTTCRSACRPRRRRCSICCAGRCCATCASR